jgi:1,4-dihydroxy-2-naphthoate octaprenyltransferase
MLKLWLECARAYSLPITVLSWLVIFCWSLQHGGSVVNGLIALVGIACAHLAANLFDDYFDYKVLSKDEKFMNSAQKCKCRLITSGVVTHKAYLAEALVLGCAACLAGGALFFLAGPAVVWLAAIGAVIVLGYSKFSRTVCGELAVAVAYGPLMFEGVYYCMTKTFSFDVLILSAAAVCMAVGVVYTHMLLDYDGDEVSYKKTLCRIIGSKNRALAGLMCIYAAGYVLLGIFAVKIYNYILFAPYLTLPPVVDLYKSMGIYIKESPDDEASFYFRFYQARNLFTYFSLILSLAMI